MRRSIPPKKGGRSSYQTFRVVNPGKGLNTLISDSLIDDHEASALSNIQFVESGAPSKAPGYTQVGNTLSNNPKGLGFYTDTTLNKYLLTTDGGVLKYLNGSTWTTISGATFDTTSTTQINMTQARGMMYIWDGVSGGCQLSSLTLTRPGTMPKAKFSIFYNGYHICSGVGSQENRIYISVLLDSSDFTNDPSVADPTPDNSTDVPGATVFSGTGTGTAIAQFIDVNKNDGDKITGFAKFQDALVIFKERSIFQMTFDSSGVPTIQAVSKSYGCVSHRSIDNVDNDVFFLTRNGLYVLGNEPNFINVIRTNELSARIHPLIDTLNSAVFTNASALFNQYVYYLGVSTGSSTTNDTVITYDKRFLAFSTWSHVTPECFTTYIDSTNSEKIYFTSANSAKVYVLTPTTYSADGSAISSSFTTKAFDLGNFSEYKRWIDCTIYFRQLLGVITIEVLTDGGNVVKSSSVSATTGNGIGSEEWGAVEWGGDISTSVSSTTTATNNIPYRLRIGTKARTIKLRVSNARNSENFVVLAYEFTYRPYSHFVFPSSNKIS
jgi:hypothetical protein